MDGNQTTGPPKWRSNRIWLAVIIMFGNAAIFFQRVSFSMVIVCMVNHTALDLQKQLLDDEYNVTGVVAKRMNHSGLVYSQPFSQNAYTHTSSVDDLDLLGTGYNNSNMFMVDENEKNINPCDRRLRKNAAKEKKEDGPFAWSKDTQGWLLGALYWGYMSSQIFGAYCVHRFGSRWTCAVSMLLMSACTMLCHPAAFWSPWAVFALRVGVGICTGFAVPAMYAMWAKWAPAGERAALVSLSFSGQNVANSLAFPTAALLCKDGFAGGWPSVFYVFGLVGIAWTALWFLLVADSPEALKHINPAERDYIIATRGHVVSKGEKITVPWKQIFGSMCFWAIAVAHFTFTWGLFLLMSNLPLYMYEVMNFDIKSNGVYSMLPYIFLGLVQVNAGFLSDVIVKRKCISLFWTRRIFCALSNIIPAIGLVLMSYLDCTDVPAVMTLLILSVGFTGFGFSCFLVNPFDIAPQFAVSITSITNSLGCIPGFVTPYLVAEITKDKTREQWQIIFFITAGIFVAGTVFYGVFGQTSLRSWAVPAGANLEIHVLLDSRDTNNEQRAANGYMADTDASDTQAWPEKEPLTTRKSYVLPPDDQR